MAVRIRIERRLTYLWTFELVGVAMWSFVVWLWWMRAGVGAASAIGLALVVLLLVQGSVYWYAKLRSIRQRPWLSDSMFVRLFSSLRQFNQVMLVATGLSGLVWVMRPPWQISPEIAIAAALWLFAVLEYINYFHRQLMYDSAADLRWLRRHRRAKVAWLARDLMARRL